MSCGQLCADPRNSYLCSGVMGECSAEEQGARLDLRPVVKYQTFS